MLAKIHGSRHFNSRRFTAKYAGSICQKKNPKNVDTWNKKTQIVVIHQGMKDQCISRIKTCNNCSNLLDISSSKAVRFHGCRHLVAC